MSNNNENKYITIPKYINNRTELIEKDGKIEVRIRKMQGIVKDAVMYSLKNLN